MRWTTCQSLSLQLKNDIAYDFCRNSGLFAFVGFNIDLVTTQHTMKCAENCPDGKISIFIYLSITKFPGHLIVTLKTGFFSQL